LLQVLPAFAVRTADREDVSNFEFQSQTDCQSAFGNVLRLRKLATAPLIANQDGQF